MSRTLALACLCLVLCQCPLGCRKASTPQWRQASSGIKAQSDVVLLAISPLDPQILHMATYEPGGLYCSSDAGLSWQPCHKGLETLTVLSLAYHPTDPNIVLAGTVLGLYRSTDGSKTWTPVPALSASYIYSLVWATECGAVYAGTEGEGVYVSADGGISWSNIGPERKSVLSIAVAPKGVIYAGTAGQGLWASEDGGVNWRRSGFALAHAFVPTLGVTGDETAWALADAALYSSRDDGETWQVTGPAGLEGRVMAAAPGTAQFIYIGGRHGGIAVSPDEGRTWDFVHTDMLDVEPTCLAVDPLEQHTAYLGTKGSGLFKTTDGGQTWLASSEGVGRQVVTALVHDPLHPQTLYAGTRYGVYKSVDGAESWTLASGGAGELYVQALALDPQDTQTIYAGSQSGVYISRDAGENWEWASQSLGSITIFCLTLAPHDRHTVYAGSWGNNILRTVDGGRSWAPVHRGLETLSVYAFAVSPADPQLLYAGTVEAVHRSADGGASWRPLQGLPEGLTTFALLFDPDDASSIYAGTTDGVYHSPDGGETWTSRSHGIGAVTVNTLAAEAGAGTLYAGTEHRGLFRSADSAAHWIPWGFEGHSVYALVVDEANGQLLVGTEEGVFTGSR